MAYTTIDQAYSSKTVQNIHDDGKRVQYSARPWREENVLEQCPNCGNGAMARKAGLVDHCPSCGWVLRKGQLLDLTSGY